MLRPESEAINKRFFEAIDELVKRRIIRGKKTFATRYELNWGNFYKLRKNPAMGFELCFLTWLVRDFGISSQWLLTGEGEMFAKRVVNQKSPV
ncbi:hypothetical protein [Spirosoma pollinicola]|uniref:Uncharacterized protein n=1 Tax=Spirosoma pollinicola TaxID=2057025 RepID=A0A2K8YTG0_9BACT|nr:hypothetical protein [Spirosoma pollinicola]AUD00922.1 hypothetical protein CWM47_03290 [Spirosoma pollinicola]